MTETLDERLHHVQALLALSTLTREVQVLTDARAELRRLRGVVAAAEELAHQCDRFLGQEYGSRYALDHARDAFRAAQEESG